MSTPPAPIRPFSQLWTDRGVPVLGRIVAHDPDAYRYLPESVHRFPAAPELAAIMRDAGLVDVGYRRLMMGVVALHVGTVPG
jgi:demethylmenaquinone methyltransferase/2-methoxy-6-polyprenyl-1,4-benzoquinol methylase